MILERPIESPLPKTLNQTDEGKYAIGLLNAESGENIFWWCDTDREYAERLYCDFSDGIIRKGYADRPGFSQVVMLRYVTIDNPTVIKGFPYDPNL